jgi:hypothetical protein
MSEPQSQSKNRNFGKLVAWGPVDAALEARLELLELERTRAPMEIIPETADLIARDQLLRFPSQDIPGRRRPPAVIVVDDPVRPRDPEREARLRAAVEKWWNLRLEAGRE